MNNDFEKEEKLDDEVLEEDNIASDNVDEDDFLNDELENDEQDSIVDEMDEESDFEGETFTYSVDNNNVNNDYNGDYGSDKSIIYILTGVVILVIIIVLLVFVANKKSSKTNDYSTIESKLITSAKDYYREHSDLLKEEEGFSTSISAKTLIENDYLKPFSEMVDSNITCDGNVTVYRGASDYVYFPVLDCGSEYKTKTLHDKIFESPIVISGDGLYNYGSTYVYRGEYPNNYVSFDKSNWRIIKINADGSFKMLMVNSEFEKVAWDDRYNDSANGYYGINNFGLSRILEYLNNVYANGNYLSDKNKNYLVKGNWCVGKMSENNVAINSLNLCNETYDGLYIGLIQADDVLIPSLDSNCKNIYDSSCTNYNYFTYNNTGWTLNASSDNSYNVFFAANGAISYNKAYASYYVRPVINVNKNIVYKGGTGTQSDPYIIGN